jgi:hypothetical protein
MRRAEPARTTSRLAAVLALALACAAAPAQTIFKYRTPDGRIVYSDKRVPGATLEEEFDRAPAPDPAAAAAQEQAARARAQAVNERAAERVRALDAVTAEIAAATSALERGQQALEAGREPREGERIGTFGGRARLNDEYWARQAANEYAIAEAEARLARARRALIELR